MTTQYKPHTNYLRICNQNYWVKLARNVTLAKKSDYTPFRSKFMVKIRITIIHVNVNNTSWKSCRQRGSLSTTMTDDT